MTYILETASNPNTLPLDIIVDGGTSNIGWLAYENSIDADEYPNVSDLSTASLSSDSWNDIDGWKAILRKFDTFAKYTRKSGKVLATERVQRFMQY